MKRFNTTGTCRHNEHYMVDITDRLEIIRKMVAQGDYFCINRGRQYGKTTTLNSLKKYLEEVGYCVFSISFESVDSTYFCTPSSTGAILLRMLSICAKRNKIKNLDPQLQKCSCHSMKSIQMNVQYLTGLLPPVNLNGRTLIEVII